MNNIVYQLTELTDIRFFQCVFIVIVAGFLWWAYHEFIALPEVPVLTAYDMCADLAKRDSQTLTEVIRKASTEKDIEYVQKRIERFSADYTYRVKSDKLNPMIVELYNELNERISQLCADDFSSCSLQ